jgi:anti-sigma regulatory factor (Ser/Thr protein kinase)
MVSESRLTVRVAAGQDGLRTAAGALDRFEAAHTLDSEAAWPMHVALDEVLSNVVRHGTAGRSNPFIEVTFVLVAGSLEVTVVDDGPEWDPLTLPPPDTAAPLEAREPGGLGVHLVRNLMDRVAYTRQDDRNRLVFARRCETAVRGARPKE